MKLYDRLFKYEKVSIESMKKQDIFVYYIACLAVIMAIAGFISQIYTKGTISEISIIIGLSTPIAFYIYKNESHKIIKGLNIE